jgi:hypothetical protein
MSKIVDVADSIYRDEINQDSSVSIASIAAWLRFGTNLGQLNNLLNTDFSINSSSLEIVDSSGTEISDLESSIYKQLYLISYYSRNAKNSMGVGGVDQILEAQSDGGVLRFVNRNELAKSYIQLKKDIELKLKGLVNAYKHNAYAPQHVTGDDISVDLTSSRVANETILGR